MNPKKIFLILFLLCIFNVANAQDFEKTVNFHPLKTGENPYRYVPFDVPKDTESISFEFTYDKKNGANRLEFGVFDTGFSGENNDKNGFRGWSGSVRDFAFISEKKATNGYSTGKIQAGKWYFIVGLAQIAPEGVDLKLKVKFNRIDEKSLKQFEDENTKQFSFNESEKPKPLSVNNLQWFRGDLHTHTFHGDGTWSVKAILDSASSNHLDFVALTEHNTFSHHSEIDKEVANYPNMLILRGEEVTTYGGHINVWGLPNGKWIDFRVLPNLETTAKQIANESRQLGALASINHPTMNCYGCNWTYDDHWGNLDSVEIWNSTWDADDEKALEIWDKLLQQGKSITAVSSSDSHKPPYESSPYPNNLPIGNPTVFIGAKKLDQENLFEGIKKGRVFAATKPNYLIEFTADKKYTIGDKVNINKKRKINLRISLSGFPKESNVFLIADGKIIKKSSISKTKFVEKIPFILDKNSYARIEIRHKNGEMLGLTNPIYFRFNR